MAGNRRTLFQRILGLMLIIAGTAIILQFFYTDLLGFISQKELKEEWKQAREETTTASDCETDTASLPTILTSADTTESTTSTTSNPVPKERINVPEKSPFARLVIPKIKLDTVVVEGVGKEALKLGPGHMEETAHPGEVGNMVISGHRVTYSRPFYYLDELTTGDPIHIHTTSQEFTYYVVETKVVKPTDVSVIQPTKDRTLTLTTCNPRFSAKTRLIIVAKMKD